MIALQRLHLAEDGDIQRTSVGEIGGVLGEVLSALGNTGSNIHRLNRKSKRSRARCVFESGDSLPVRVTR